jgi:hypothetical protein
MPPFRDLVVAPTRFFGPSGVKIRQKGEKGTGRIRSKAWQAFGLCYYGPDSKRPAGVISTSPGKFYKKGRRGERFEPIGEEMFP